MLWHSADPLQNWEVGKKKELTMFSHGIIDDLRCVIHWAELGLGLLESKAIPVLQEVHAILKRWSSIWYNAVI